MMPRLRGNGRESSFYVIIPIITHDLNAITGQHLRVEKKNAQFPGKLDPWGKILKEQFYSRLMFRDKKQPFSARSIFFINEYFVG